MILASISHRLFLLAPILALNYPYTVTFDLVASDLRGGNYKKKRTHEKCNVAYTLFFTLLRKHFSGYGLARKGEKPVFLCDV